jgi:hemoglobin
MMPVDQPGPRRRGAPIERFGGAEAVARVVDAFYDRVEADPELRAVFPRDLEAGREKQKAFLEEWLGGERRYSTQHGHPMLRRRHFPFVIGRRHAERWLQHMAEAMRACEVDPDVAAEVLQRLEPLAYHMVNEGEDVPREPFAPPRPPFPPR